MTPTCMFMSVCGFDMHCVIQGLFSFFFINWLHRKSHNMWDQYPSMLIQVSNDKIVLGQLPLGGMWSQIICVMHCACVGGCGDRFWHSAHRLCLGTWSVGEFFTFLLFCMICYVMLCSSCFYQRLVRVWSVLCMLYYMLCCFCSTMLLRCAA